MHERLAMTGGSRVTADELGTGLPAAPLRYTVSRTAPRAVRWCFGSGAFEGHTALSRWLMPEWLAIGRSRPRSDGGDKGGHLTLIDGSI